MTSAAATSDPAVFFEWDPETVTNTFTVYPFGDYTAEDMDIAGDVVYYETGEVIVDGSSISIMVFTEDGVNVPHREVFGGTWAIVAEELVFTMVDGPTTIVMTWVR